MALLLTLVSLAGPTFAQDVISASPNPNGGDFTISWENPNGQGYNLLEKPSGGSTWTVIAAGWGTYHNVTNKPAGSYDYRKQFCQLSGPMAGCRNIYSNTITVTVYSTPAAPTGLSGPSTDYNGSYTISWNASSGATSYVLQERVGSGSWTQVHSGSATSKAISGKSAGTYSYRVKACVAGTICSGWSGTHTVTVPSPPSIPTGLTGPSTDYDGAYTISWSSSSGSSTYQLQEQVGSGSWTQVHSGSATSKAISGKTQGSYSYRVRGCGGESVCSGWSGTHTVTVPAPPSTPTGLNGPSTDYDGAYTISWNSSSGSSTYQLQEQVGAGSWTQVHSGTATSKAISGKTQGTYSYRVRGCSGESVCSGWSGTHTVTVPAPPSTPTGLTGPATDYDGDYTISWNSSSGSSTYQLQEQVGAGSWAQVHSGSATSKAISGKTQGTYSYRVRGCSGESVCSGWSGTHTVTVPSPPAVPAGLTGPSTDYDGAYTISWNSSSGSSTYQLQEQVGAGSWTQVHSGSATSKAISGKTQGTYSYRVRGCSGESVCSSWSGTHTVTVPSPPSTPTGLTGPATDYNGAYTISWNTSSGSNTYELQEQVGTGSWVQVHSGSATSKAISGKAQGTYSYRVRGCSGESVCSGWSATHTVTVPAPPEVPTGLTGPAVSQSGSYTISWNPSTGSSSYRLEERKDSGTWTQIHSGSATSKSVSGKSLGTYSYRVRGCNVESVCSAWSSLHTVEVPPGLEPPSAPPAPAPLSDPGPASASETDTIGSTAGNFRVDETGAATYSIPILTAAGTAGVKPDITLNYSSGSGNNIAGMGWSIGGLSAVSRCKQSYDQDRNVTRISFSASDRFCLDGTRLLLDSAHNYGDPGSTYRSEIDDGAIAIAHGSSSGEPDYFEVRRKDGSTSYYGKTPNNGDVTAKLSAGSGRTLTWAIRQFSDSVGNSIWFEYETANGGQRIKRIKWAYGTSSDPVSGYGAMLEFSYVSRPDRKSGYVDGSLFQNDKRLDTIVSYNNVNQEIRRYKLRYNEGYPASVTNISRLTSIEECVGTTCLANRTTFGWRLPTVSPSLGIVDSFSIGSSATQLKPVDINGDGRMDIVWLEGNVGQYTLKYAIFNGSSFVTQTFSSGAASVQLNSYLGNYTPLDYNVDGRQDLAFFNYSIDRWMIFLSVPVGNGQWKLSPTPIETSIPKEEVTFADVDSNGTVDAVVEFRLPRQETGKLVLRRLEPDPGQPESSSAYYGYGSPINIAGPDIVGAVHGIRPDFDGDGQTDVVEVFSAYICDPTCEWNKSFRALSFAGFDETNPTTTEYYTFTASEDIGNFEVVDINGDGLSDAFYSVRAPSSTETQSYRLEVNRGDGTFDLVQTLTGGITDEDARPQFADWNMDGYPDLIWRELSGGGNLYIRYWNPSTDSLDGAVILTSQVSSSTLESVLIFDVNGDSVPDLMTMNAGGTLGSMTVRTRKEGAETAFVAVDRIETIANGLGAETSVEYEPLSYSEHYERLEYSSTTETATFCEFSFCYDQPIQVPDADAFYEQINGDWDYPSGWQFLPKTSPIIEMAGPLYVVTRIQSDAPAATGTPGNVNNSARSAIAYHYGEAKIQAAGRGFLGFQRLTTVDEQSGVETTTRYRQDWPFSGRPISTMVASEQGHLLSTSTTLWEVVEWDANTAQTATDYGTSALGSLHVVQKEHKETTYDLVADGTAAGAKLASTTTVGGFDAEGNATSVTVTTRNGADQVVKSVHTSNEYDEVAFSLWEGRLERTTVTVGTSVRTSAFSYHQSGALRGLLKTETVEPDLPDFTLVTEHFYDARGNRVGSKQTGGSEVRCDTITSDYDDMYRYVEATFDCLGRKVTEVTARNEFGQPTVVETYVGPMDSYSTHIAYSDLGRQYYRYVEDGSSETTYLTANTANCPAGTSYKGLKSTAGGTETQECFDALGRVNRVLTRGFDGLWDAQDTEYDQFGRVSHKSEPYDLGSGALYWTSFDYDRLGRVTRADLPDGSWATTSYSGLTTVKTAHTNVGNQSKTEIRDALGQLVQVIDNLQGNTLFEYDEQGNLWKITDNADNTTVMEYDLVGRKELTDDPDKGVWEYDYTHFGELKFQKNANGQTSTITYDGLGRIKTRTDRLTENGPIEASAVWEYDTAAYGLGQLANVQDTVSGFMRATTFDNLGRASETITTFGGGIYYEMTTYDQFGRVFQVFDAAGDGSYTSDGIVNGYNAFGYLETVADAVHYGNDPRIIYQRILEMNARGQVTLEERGIDFEQGAGPAVTTTYDYWAATGRMKSISGLNPLGFDVQDLRYTWDQLGNLKLREEYSGGKSLSESFEYDGLNRLISQAVAGLTPVTVTYDPDLLGNIRTKSDVGTYEYNSSRPHAVTSAGGATYTYDANGNNLTGDGRTIKYRTFDKPYEITKGGHKVTFSYGPERARYLRVDEGAEGTTTTRYIGSVEIITRPSGVQERKRYIGGIAIESRTVTGGSESGRTTRYLHLDHLGSLDVITDDAGEIVQELSFDAWGQRRNATNWAALSAAELIGFDHGITTRGFTGHEMLDEVGVIHMNGRIYDPKLARFLQADPVVQDPTNSQSLNRYSYVWNNPLNATDPSGYFVFSLIAALVIGAEFTFANIAAYFLAGVADTLAAGGQFKDALLSGIAAGVSFGAFSKIGGVLNSRFAGNFAANLSGIGFSIKVASHGIIGGITSVIQGGKFGHGFAAGSFTAAATSFNNSQFIGGHGASPLRVVVGAVIGGTASTLTGGKFANGALTGAFSQALNHEAHEDRVDEMVKLLREDGYNVKRGLKFSVMVDGQAVSSIADYAYVTKDGDLILGEVKTGEHAKFTPKQQVAYFEALEKHLYSISDAGKRALGLPLDRRPPNVRAVSLVAESGSRVLRQVSTRILRTGSGKVLGRVAVGAVTVLGSTAATAAELLFYSSDLGVGSDCPTCMIHLPPAE